MLENIEYLQAVYMYVNVKILETVKVTQNIVQTQEILNLKMFIRIRILVLSSSRFILHWHYIGTNCSLKRCQLEAIALSPIEYIVLELEKSAVECKKRGVVCTKKFCEIQ